MQAVVSQGAQVPSAEPTGPSLSCSSGKGSSSLSAQERKLLVHKNKRAGPGGLRLSPALPPVEVSHPSVFSLESVRVEMGAGRRPESVSRDPAG